MKDMDMSYKCLECDTQEIVKAENHRKDGRVCKKCKGKLVPTGFIGIDLARGEDITVIGTPGQKNRKMTEVWENGT